MSGTANYYDPTFEPFSFKNWDNQEHILNPPLNFAEERAMGCEQLADEDEALGDVKSEEEHRAAAAWWRSLSTLPNGVYELVDREQSWKANEAVDALLARAVTSRSAMYDLILLSDKLSKGLDALIVQKHPDHASLQLGQLREAVDRFAVLARHKPELFREPAQRSIGIPGIISLSKELTKAQEELLHLLEVGNNYPFRLGPFGKKGRTASLQDTPANLWASRLFEYICAAIPRLEIWSRPSAPVWATQARQLDSFDAASCERWFDVAWMVILETTEGHPEKEEVLFKIGEAAYRRKLRAGSGRDTEETRLGFVRDKIKDRLRQAFWQLAGVGSKRRRANKTAKPTQIKKQ